MKLSSTLLIATFICVCAMVSTGIAGKLKDFSHDANVTEGSWANFSCKYRKEAGHIRWNIGKFTGRDGVTVEGLDTVSPSLYTRRYGHVSEKIDKKTYSTEKIGILATVELDGTAVQCTFDAYKGQESDEYSKFVIMTVHPAAVVTDDTNTEEAHSPSQSSMRNRRSATNSYTASPASTSASGGQRHAAVAVTILFAVALSLG